MSKSFHPDFPRRRCSSSLAAWLSFLGGLGLLIHPVRRAAGWGLIALLIAVYPAIFTWPFIPGALISRLGFCGRVCPFKLFSWHGYGSWQSSRPPGQTHLNCCTKLLQAVEYQYGYSSRPALAEGSSSKVFGRGMIGKGMKAMTLVLFPCQTFPCPFFSLVSGYQILHFAAVRVKLDASALSPPAGLEFFAGWADVGSWFLLLFPTRPLRRKRISFDLASKPTVLWSTSRMIMTPLVLGLACPLAACRYRSRKIRPKNARGLLASQGPPVRIREAASRPQATSETSSAGELRWNRRCWRNTPGINGSPGIAPKLSRFRAARPRFRIY